MYTGLLRSNTHTLAYIPVVVKLRLRNQTLLWLIIIIMLLIFIVITHSIYKRDYQLQKLCAESLCIYFYLFSVVCLYSVVL